MANILVSAGNSLLIKKSRIEKSRITIKGTSNEVVAENALISNTTISVSGSNNKIIINENVSLRRAVIHIRGNNCAIIVGKGTSFGGIRIVNIGNNNSINIGQQCLFADHIELWASDTHSILNECGEKLNPEESVSVGDRVWVGSHVIILKGVTIYNDSVIGMGSVVTKDVPPKTISAGVPNRIIREGITWKKDD